MKIKLSLIVVAALAWFVPAAWAADADQSAGGKVEQGANEMNQGAEQGVQQGSQAVQQKAQDWTQLFDKSKVETDTGTITEVESVKSTLGVTHSLHIYLKTDKETLLVVVAPTSYLDSKNLALHKDDQVDVTGSRVMVNNRPTIIATQIKKGSQTVPLRDSDGKPMWSDTTNPGSSDGGY